VEPPASADAENAGSEEKSKYSEENVESSEELRYIEDSSEITPIQPKSHLRGKSLLTIAACAGAGLAIVAGLFGLRFRRRRKKGAKKGKHENKA
jgi:hypothetical protein